MTVLLNREQMLAKADDIPTAEVEVPEWGGSVKVKALGTQGRLQWILARENTLAEKEDALDPTALLVVLGAVGEDNVPVFTIQDIDWLSKANGEVVERIANEVARMSGLIDGADADAEGNSDATLSGDSPSDLPETSDAPLPSLAAV